MNRTMLYPGFLKKALTLSYDDGIDCDARLIAVMNRYGIKGTFNVTTGRFAQEGQTFPPEDRWHVMTEKETFDLYLGNGMEVAVHCRTHPHLENLTLPEVTQEVLEDRIAIEAHMGKPCRGMAYPYGTFNDDVVSVLKSCGILYARTVISSKSFGIPSDWLRLRPTCRHGEEDMLELAKNFIEQPAREPMLFYMWGHTYEFIMYDNWDLIERFCQIVGNNASIWYATNSEIFEYIEAYKSLRTTADGSVVFNPTAFELFFEAKGKAYSVKPGMTVKVE